MARALGLAAALTAVAGVVLAWMFSRVANIAVPAGSLVLDALITLCGFAALAWAVFVSADVRRGMLVVIVALVATEAAYQAQIYRILGIPVAQGIARYELDAADRTPLPAAIAGDPNALTRKICTRFGECYLSTHDTASLNLDIQGTFLRSKGEAVFQRGLARSVIEALSAIGHPIFWTSRRIEPYADAADLTKRLNDNAARIAEHLGEVTYVRPDDLERLGRPPAGDGRAMLFGLSRGADWLRLSYRADAPFYLNAAVTRDPHWQVAVNGRMTMSALGNFGGIVLAAPSGAGTVEFRYVNRGVGSRRVADRHGALGPRGHGLACPRRAQQMRVKTAKCSFGVKGWRFQPRAVKTSA